VVPYTVFLAHPFVPGALYPSFYESLVSDDTLLLRTLAHFSVTRISDGPALLSALLDIFAYAGKVSVLLVTLAMLDFDTDSLNPNLLLRTNSHLTSLIKVFGQRFGQPYFDSVIAKIIDYILAAGDIRVSNPEQCDMGKARAMIVTCLDAITRSGPAVPPELRHLGSILRGSAGMRFNNKQAVFNTLSAYFCLRFIGGALADPAAFGYAVLPPAVRSAVLVPFAQLLIAPMALSVYSGIFDPFRSCNHHLVKHVFPGFAEFVFSIGECDCAPVYAPPEKERLREAIETVVRLMAKSPEAVRERYEGLVADAKGRTPVKWTFGVFLLSFFQVSIPG
jgi:hypothetical protein